MSKLNDRVPGNGYGSLGFLSAELCTGINTFAPRLHGIPICNSNYIPCILSAAGAHDLRFCQFIGGLDEPCRSSLIILQIYI